MSQYSNIPTSTVAGVIETVGRELAEEGTRFAATKARGTQPRAKRYSDRPMDLRLERSSIVIDEPDLSEDADTQPLVTQQVTTRMRRLVG